MRMILLFSLLVGLLGLMVMVACENDTADDADEAADGAAEEAAAEVDDESVSEDAPSGGVSDAAALIEERCSGCHGLDKVEAAEMDEAGWIETVDRMIDHGAELNETERELVIAELSAD